MKFIAHFQRDFIIFCILADILCPEHKYESANLLISSLVLGYIEKKSD